jgi:hypothetical protein
MPEHDASLDPLDKAYAEAEAVLDDAQARAARRARVLAAVQAPDAQPAPSPLPARKAARGRAGWLIAASVAGLSVFVATRINPPAEVGPVPAPAAKVAAAEAPPSPVARSPVSGASSQPAKPAPATTAMADAAAPSAPEAPPSAPPPPPQLAQARQPSAPPAAPSAMSESLSDLVVTGARREAGAEQRAAAPAAVATVAAPDPSARLRAAAAAGRTGEMSALLDRGAPVDAPDDQGETALMKSIRADQPAAAALLLRHGASLDRTNAAGDSARSIARSADDAELNRALGLD